MPKRSVYPRGFDTVQPNGSLKLTITTVDGDSEVTQLYNQHMTKHGEYRSWAFQSAVLRAAKRLIGRSLLDWVEVQNRNKYLNGNAIRFLADTLRFIDTGRREISNINWLPLLTNMPQEDLLQNRKFVLTPAHIAIARKCGNNFLKEWLDAPGGYEDLLVTLYILYGEIDAEAALNASGAMAVQSPKNYKAQLLKKLFDK
jgi:hypothetical protein